MKIRPRDFLRWVGEWSTRLPLAPWPVNKSIPVKTISALSALLFVGITARRAEAQPPKVEFYPKETEYFEGACPLLSPNGRLVALRRYVPEQKVFATFRNPNPMREDVWIRDLRTGEERLLCKESRPLEWLGDDALMLASNQIIDPFTGITRVPVSQFPRTLAVADTLTLLAADAKTIRFALGHTIVSDLTSQEKGMMWVSPKKNHVSFDLLFSRSGNIPLRRIGVAQVATTRIVYVGESAYCHYNWGYHAQERSGCKSNPWAPDESRFAFVAGRGDGEANLYLASADGSQVWRLTNDESCKWSPVFDATGRRIAYFAARWGGQDGSLLDGQVRVLDIYTGEQRRFAPTTAPGLGLSLSWAADGSELIHDWHPGKMLDERSGTPRTYRVKLSKSQRIPPGAVVKVIPSLSKEDEVVTAILSKSSVKVSWGVEHVGDAPTQRVKAALRTALPIWFPRDLPCAGEIVGVLTSLGASEAVPAFRQAVLILPEPTRIPDGTPDDVRKQYRLQYQQNAVCEVIAALVKWNVKASAVELRTYLKRFPDSEPAVYATGALASFGEEDRWVQLAAYAKSSDKEIRSRLTAVLSLVHDPRAVDVLLELVNDHERLYTSVEGETQVGDEAQNSLRKLTGQRIGRDLGAWREWWTKQGRRLPTEAKP